MTEVRLRMWHEWSDKGGAYHTEEASFDAWKTAMHPHRDALLAVWATELQLLLERNPETVPYEALHVLYDQAETLRTLDDEPSWKEPFNQMRGATQQGDHAALRALVAVLT